MDRKPKKGAKTKADSSVVIREARRSDLPAIRRLLSRLAGTPLSVEAAKDRLRLIAGTKGEEMIVATLKARVIGLLTFRVRHNVESQSCYGEISAIIVADSFRRKGIGQLLLKQAEVIAKRFGCIGLWLVSGFGREKEAHKFYRKLGFECTGARFVKPF
jgi:N-acetylglutamate synthase-like GNAT family acetyltransferase